MYAFENEASGGPNGYVTAALATFFVGRDAESIDAEVAGAEQLAELRDEIRALSLPPPGSCPVLIKPRKFA